MGAFKVKSGLLLTLLLSSTCFVALTPGVAHAVQTGTVLDVGFVRFASFPSLNPFSPTYVNPVDSELYLRCAQNDYSPGSPTTLILCNSWKANANFTTFTFNLISGLKWSDGISLNSTDLAYSFAAANATGRFSPYLTSIETLNATGASLTIPASEPNLVAIAMAEVFIVPKHIFDKTPLSQIASYTAFDAVTVCAGSYCPTQPYVQGTNPLILVPNQYYYLGHNQYYSEVHAHIFQSNTAADAALFAGQISAVAMPGLQYTAASAVAFQKPGFQVYSFPAPNLFQIIHFNYLKAPFDNVNFRQGLAYATDRNLISQAISGGGYSNIPYGLVLPAPAGENEYSYNLTAAEASFVKAGLHYDGTTLKYSNGTQVSFDVTYPSGEPDSQSVATLLVIQWSKVGIQVTPTLVEDTTLFADYGSGNWGVSTLVENGAAYSTCCHFIDQMQSSGGYSISTLASKHATSPSDYVTSQIGQLIQQWAGVPLGTSGSDSLSAQIAPLMAEQVVAIPLWAIRGGYVFSTSMYWGVNDPSNPVLNTGAYDLQDEVQLQTYHSTWYYAQPATGQTTSSTTSSTTSQSGGGGGAFDYTPYLYGGIVVVVIVVVAAALMRRRPSKAATS